MKIQFLLKNTGIFVLPPFEVISRLAVCTPSVNPAVLTDISTLSVPLDTIPEVLAALNQSLSGIISHLSLPSFILNTPKTGVNKFYFSLSLL